MTRIDRVLKKLSDLYEFNRKLKAYQLQKDAKNSTNDSRQQKSAPSIPWPPVED